MTTFDEAAGTRPSTPAEATRDDPHRLPDVFGLVVGILGGTGPQGRGLAYRARWRGPTGHHRVRRRRPGRLRGSRHRP